MRPEDEARRRKNNFYFWQYNEGFTDGYNSALEDLGMKTPRKTNVTKTSPSITKLVQKGVKGGFMPKGEIKCQAVRMKKTS